MRDDRGSATVIGAFAVLALLSLALMVAHVGVVVATEHRIQGIADAAALAAAAQAAEGEVLACRVAASTAGRSIDCRLDGWDAVVSVSEESGGRTITVSARAGPV